MTQPTLYDLEMEVCSCYRFGGMPVVHQPYCAAHVVRQEWARRRVADALTPQQPEVDPGPLDRPTPSKNPVSGSGESGE